VKIKRFLEGLACPECGSKKIGLVDGEIPEVAQMASERAERGKVSDKFKEIYRTVLESGELIGIYGLPAALALAAKGLSKTAIVTVASSKTPDIDFLVDMILREEKEVLRKRYKRTHPQTQTEMQD
ncbi:MAG: hypothetical protein QXU75_06895, partial [Candidatus Methanomethylicaceae archaeon]